MEGLTFRNEVPGLWNEVTQSRFEDLIIFHPHLTKKFFGYPLSRIKLF